LRLVGCAWLEIDVEGAEFDCPLGDSSSSILVPQDVTERAVGDDGDQVLLEVVSSFREVMSTAYKSLYTGW
jgi:hypothetical protein